MLYIPRLKCPSLSRENPMYLWGTSPKVTFPVKPFLAFSKKKKKIIAPSVYTNYSIYHIIYSTGLHISTGLLINFAILECNIPSASSMSSHFLWTKIGLVIQWKIIWRGENKEMETRIDRRQLKFHVGWCQCEKKQVFSLLNQTENLSDLSTD